MVKRMKKLSNVFSVFVKKTLSSENLESALNELNLLLIGNDVATETADILCQKINESLKGEQVSRLTSKNKFLFEVLKDAITDILTPEKNIDLLEEIRKKNKTNSPYIICFLGVNGTGKTTTIAKIAHYLKKNNISSVVAAADTFRAAAIEQLSYHMQNIGIKVIKHEYKSDPASVAYDAVQHAKAKNINVVLVDTAGRQVSNKNLMQEMQKIVRVAEPDLTLFIGDSLAGNDALTQAKEFNNSVGIDANILTKFDADAKGGAALSISYETKKPILFIGIGQGYDDLEPFNRELFISNILNIREE
jgi:fused signal recognition particle receptor